MTGRGDREQFFVDLDALRAAAQSPTSKRLLSVKAIAKDTTVPESTVRSWFPTKRAAWRTVPRDDEQLLMVVEYFLRRAGRLAERAHLDRRTREDWLSRRDAAAADEPTELDTPVKALPGWAGLVEYLEDGELPQLEQLSPYQLGSTPNRYGEGEGPGVLDIYVARSARNVDGQVAAALAEQRMVVITGPSKAGKTRTLFEAARRVLPNARLLVPHPDTLHHIPSHPRFTTSTDVIVIWLENLQDFLTSEHPLSPALLAHLGTRPARTVVAATLRSEALTRLRGDNGGELTRDSRAVLDRARLIELVSTSEDPTEQAAARAAYPSLPLEQHGLAEILAGAPELLRRYDAARVLEPVLRAVIEVAIDWIRVGHPDPIPEITLAELALTRVDEQRADLDVAPDDVRTAIQMACTRTEQVGRVAALHPSRNPDRTRAFQAFDYLVAADDGQAHPYRPIPNNFWHTITQQAKPSVLLRVGYQAFLREHLDVAEAIWRRLAATDPTGMSFLGYLQEKRGNSEEAEVWYRRALDADPNYAYAMDNLGDLYQDRGDLGEAEVWYRRALDADPNYAPTMDSLGDLYRDRGDLGEAEVWYRRALDADPNYAYAMDNLGDLYRDRGDLGEAEVWFRRALAAAPQHAFTYIGLGDLYRDRGDLDETESWYRRALDVEPQHPLPHIRIGRVLKARGNLDEAETWFRRALDADPNYAYAMDSLGDLYRDRGDLDEAESWYRRALDIDPNNKYIVQSLNELLKVRVDRVVEED